MKVGVMITMNNFIRQQKYKLMIVVFFSVGVMIYFFAKDNLSDIVAAFSDMNYLFLLASFGIMIIYYFNGGTIPIRPACTIWRSGDVLCNTGTITTFELIG